MSLRLQYRNLGPIGKMGFVAQQFVAYAWFTLQGKPYCLPEMLKHRVIRKYLKMLPSNYGSFIETGTYLGDTIAALKRRAVIHSIEIQEQFVIRARQRFRKWSNIHIWHGSSTEVLPEILKELYFPAVFWLDAHFPVGSGEQQVCPTPEEIRLILAHRKDHIILVDDAREFVGRDGYPSVRGLQQHVASLAPEYTFRVAHDIIRITPARTRFGELH